MIIPVKTYTDNPFVDNLIYYAKLMALNSTVKDEEEALAKETPQSLYDGDVYIACIEQTTRYEMFKSIPVEILEKYIKEESNLDLYVRDPSALTNHLNSMDIYTRTNVFNRLSRLARIIYIDHYDVMRYYIENISPTWFEDYKELYDKCVDGSASYKDLYEELPHHTTLRIIKQYINNYDNTDMNVVGETLETFQAYIDTRTDVNINTELENVSNAMKCVFRDHYEIMQQRNYIGHMSEDDWVSYIHFTEAYDKCIDETATYRDLFDLFPEDDLEECLKASIDPETVDDYMLSRSLNTLQVYFRDYSTNPEEEINKLNKLMIRKYIENYNMYCNFDVYNKCKARVFDYYDLMQYLPYETKKIILNSEIEEYTNLQVYSKDKNMLNSYLNTLPKEEKERIKRAINIDMRSWYPKHHVETNNYYRALIGLPPLDSDGNQLVDTLVHTYDESQGTFIEFGNKFTRHLPVGIYPEIHWEQELYMFDDYDMGIIKEYGLIDGWLNSIGASTTDDRYKYIKYLGDEKLDLYTCRKAGNFELIGVPTIDDDVAKKQYLDKYAINRDFIIRTVFSDSHKFESDYYNKFMIIFIILNTIMDMLNSIPETIIDREVFDSRCIKYIFESNGIPYYSEIPVKYQRAMLKNLNILIKYKGSYRNMIDICNLFGFSDIRVFGYYLFKERLKDPHTGNFLFEEDTYIDYDLDLLYVKDQSNGQYTDYNGVKYTKLLEYRNYDEDKYLVTISYTDEDGIDKTKKIINNEADVYLRDNEYDDIFIPLKDSTYFKQVKANTDVADLKFIKVPIDDDWLGEYKNDDEYINNYDEIVYQDEGNTWDGGLIHEQLRQRIEDYDFNAVHSKYVSIETVTEMTELSFQVSYFYNLLFDNMWSEEALTVEVPFIKIGHKFRFMDIVCYLFALMYIYNGIEDKIMYSPTQILYIKGYNYDEALDHVLQDATAFSQDEDPMGQEDIFDVNWKIENEDYDYQEAFKYYGMRAFNLNADIDRLDKWLQWHYQMSVDDFIVDDSLTVFDHIITLRDFYTLNNSYYQKSIFNGEALLPLPYNELIKYAFNYFLYEIEYEYDLNMNKHGYASEKDEEDVTYFMEVIPNNNIEIYIMDYYEYLVDPYDDTKYTTFYKYKKSGDIYLLADHQPYRCIDEEYSRIFPNNIYIRDKDGRYIFSADHYYRHPKDNPEAWEEITEENHFYPDPYEEDKKVLSFGEYYIYKDGMWVLDPDNCWILIYRNGESKYVLLKDIDQYANIVIEEKDCYIMHSDRHFVPLVETDYWRKAFPEDSNWDDSDYDWMKYLEEECYVIVGKETEWFDPTVEPRVYYQPLSDFYSENNWLFYKDTYYVKDPEGNFIPEYELVSPNNCYYVNKYGSYELVIDYLCSYLNYNSPRDVKYAMILQENYDYIRYEKREDNYYPVPNELLQYCYNSDTNYLLVLDKNAIYKDTNLMIVVFNKEITRSDSNLLEKGKYNPEETDNKWDENDWFYYDPSYVEGYNNAIGMNGENKWYYRKPGEEDIFEEKEDGIVGAGFYMESTAYLGDVELEYGCRYYIAMDIIPNFTGKLQVYCTADSECNNPVDRLYDVTRYETLHVAQIITANKIADPELRFLIYNFDKYPIHIGDYVVVKNIRFVKAYNDNFIAQDIPSYDQLQLLYRTNEAIYKYLTSLMANCTEKHEYRMLKHIYDSLMISKYNKEAFKLDDGTYATTYTDFLRSRDAVLYERLTYFKSLDPDAMHKQVADNIVEVTYGIDDCIDTYSYAYLYSYFPAVSANYIQQYICKLIRWFKSWKVHLLGINTVYKFNDPNENTVRALEDRSYRVRIDEDKCNVFVYGDLKINPLDAVNPSGVPYPELYPDMCDPTHVKRDKVEIRDRLRIISRIGNRIEYKDGEIHFVFNDENIVPSEENHDLVINSPNAGFSVANINDMIMSHNENTQEVWEAQLIDEINHTSTDTIEWEDYQEDE